MKDFGKINKMNTGYRDAFVTAIAAALILILPLMAKLFSDDFAWSPGDFLAAWILLFGAGFSYKLLSKKMNYIPYKAAAGIAVAAALFLVWSNLAVGLIGSEDNPANLMYFTVLAVGAIGTLIVQFKPSRMSYVLFVMAIVQVLVTAVALIANLGYPENTPVQIVFINGFFITLWIISALLFRFPAGKHI